MANQIELPIEIRDRRNSDWYWVHRTVRKEYGPKIGVIGFALYNAYASYANDQGEAWPSLKTLSDELQISIPTIVEYNKLLEKHKLIKIQSGKKKGRSNIIYLLKIEGIKEVNTPLEGIKEVNRGIKQVNTGIKQVNTIKNNIIRTNNKNPKGEKKTFPRQDYIKIHEAYKKYKGIEPQGKEWDPIDRDIKLMFESKRTPKQIIGFMKWLDWASRQAMGGIREYEWTWSWTIKTCRMKIAEFVAGKFEEMDGRKTLKEMYPDKLPKD